MLPGWPLLFGLLLLAGCASGPTGKRGGFIFYPPPPSAPRLQFLTAISSERDLGPASSGFAEFVTGVKPEWRLDKAQNSLAQWFARSSLRAVTEENLP